MAIKPEDRGAVGDVETDDAEAVREWFEAIWDQTGIEHHKGRKKTEACEVCGVAIGKHPCFEHRQAVQQEPNRVPPPGVF